MRYDEPRLVLLEDYGLPMLLDRDTRRSPRTRVLAVITRRSAHCSLLRTHKPGSQLLLCPASTPMPLAQVLTHCSTAQIRPPKVHELVPNISRSGPRNVTSDITLFHVSSSSSRHAPART